MERNFSKIWSTQSCSGNRSASAQYLSRKASEMLCLLQDYCGYANHEVIDIGCGAGELLIYLCEKLNVIEAIDYSESMLAQCEKEISNSLLIRSHPVLSLGDIDRIANLKSHFLISTGALSQYSSYAKIQDAIKLFSENIHPTHLILFDTIDPFRFSIYRFIAYKNSFEDAPKSVDCNSQLRASAYSGISKIMNFFKSSIKYFYFSFITIVDFVRILSSSSGVIDLSGFLMGYGVKASVWRDLAKQHGLRCQIVSSREFEYRYHVLLSK